MSHPRSIPASRSVFPGEAPDPLHWPWPDKIKHFLKLIDWMNEMRGSSETLPDSTCWKIPAIRLLILLRLLFLQNQYQAFITSSHYPDFPTKYLFFFPPRNPLCFAHMSDWKKKKASRKASVPQQTPAARWRQWKYIWDHKTLIVLIVFLSPKSCKHGRQTVCIATVGGVQWVWSGFPQSCIKRLIANYRAQSCLWPRRLRRWRPLLTTHRKSKESSLNSWEVS